MTPDDLKHARFSPFISTTWGSPSTDDMSGIPRVFPKVFHSREELTLERLIVSRQALEC